MARQHKELLALDNNVMVTVRPNNYRALVLERGLSKLLQDDSILKSDENDILIGNFASFVARTVNVELVVNSEDESARDWVMVWQLVVKQEYLNAYESYLELCDFGDNNLSDVWNKVVMESSDTLIKGDIDLAPPDKISEVDKQDSKKKKSA